MSAVKIIVPLLENFNSLDKRNNYWHLQRTDVYTEEPQESLQDLDQSGSVAYLAKCILLFTVATFHAVKRALANHFVRPA
jgi:hypothetical protein